MKKDYNKIFGITYLISFILLIFFIITFFPMYEAGLFESVIQNKPYGYYRPMLADFSLHHAANVLINVFIILFSFFYLLIAKKNSFLTSLFPIFRLKKIKADTKEFSRNKKIFLFIILLILFAFGVANFVISMANYFNKDYLYILLIMPISILTLVNMSIFFGNLFFNKKCKDTKYE